MTTYLKLTNDGDIDMSNGKASWVEGSEAVAQALRVRLNFWEGEWFLNPLDGTPYRRYVIGHRDLTLARAVIIRRIEETEGVLPPIRDFVMDFDTKTRNLSISFLALTIYGDLNFTQIFEV